MQISKVTLMTLFIGAAAWQLGAQPASPDLQSQAIQLLRQTIAQQEAHASETPRVATPAAPASKTKTAKPKTTKADAGATGGSATTNVKASPGKEDKAPAPAMPEQPAGPKTKQERLMELLDLYKADKLSPSEYHAQRAKILAEP